MKLLCSTRGLGVSSSLRQRGEPLKGTLKPSKAVDHFQARGVQQGQKFDEQCRLVLGGLGFEVSEKPFPVSELGCEFDAEITAMDGTRYWCEFKGSWHGDRPGLRRTDTVKKALCDAFLANEASTVFPPVLILTTHLPSPASSGAQMLKVALASGALLDVICVNDPEDMKRLKRLT